MKTLLLIAFFFTVSSAKAATLMDLRCSEKGFDKNFYVTNKNGEKHLKEDIRFENKASCEAALEKARKNPANVSCVPAELGLSRMFTLYSFQSGKQIGRSVFGKERCDQQADSAKPDFVCALEAGIASVKFLRFNQSGAPLDQQTYTTLADCTKEKAKSSPSATEDAAPAGDSNTSAN
ncbi:MAG: hypothetical protein AB7K68_03255 [Bacteriovoracia bacterium]